MGVNVDFKINDPKASKFVRKYRQCDAILRMIESKVFDNININNTNHDKNEEIISINPKINDLELYQYSLDYELYFTLKEYYFWKCIEVTGLVENVSIELSTLLRRLIEIDCLYRLTNQKGKELSKTNLRIFKIKTLHTEVGEKELKKLSSSFNISLKAFKSLLSSPSCSFLIGLIPDYSRPRTLIENAFKNDPEALEVMLANYDSFSSKIHEAYEDIPFIADDVRYVELINKTHAKKLKEVLRLTNDGPITGKKIFEAKCDHLMELIIKLDYSLQSLPQNIFKPLFNKKRVDEKEVERIFAVFIHLFNFLKSTYSSLIVSYSDNEIKGTLILNKYIFERIALFNFLINEVREVIPFKFRLYWDSSVYYTAHLLDTKSKEDIKYDESMKQYEKEIEDGSIELFNALKKYNRLNRFGPLTKEELLNRCKLHPSYAIYLKDNNLTSNVSLMLYNLLPNKNDKSELSSYLLSYIKGVEVSHSSCALLFKDDETFKIDIYHSFKLVNMFATKVIDFVFNNLSSLYSEYDVGSNETLDIFSELIKLKNVNDEIKDEIDNIFIKDNKIKEDEELDKEELKRILIEVSKFDVTKL